MNYQKKPVRRLHASLAALALSASAGVLAQEATTEVAEPSAPIEEVVVIGRYKAAATDVVSERIDEDVPMDFLDAEAISRAGDSNVAAALRRVPGLTLAKGSFVYVRGLGERYSSTQLNGARVPSPDLTRNVLPLDIFPASTIDSLAVSKGYSPNLPASFGGGNIDIRTKSIPEDRILDFSMQIALPLIESQNVPDRLIQLPLHKELRFGSLGGCPPISLF